MTASRVGLAVLAAIAVLLVVALGLDLTRGRGDGATRELWPGLGGSDVDSIAWTRAGAPTIAIRRDADGWSTASGGAAVDPAALDAVLTALRGARWHRRADASAAGSVRAVIRVGAGGEVHELGLGAPLPGGEQGWVTAGDRALLVDAWVLRALDVDALALRVRAPLADVTGRVSFRRGDVAIEVDLAAGAMRQPTALALAPDRVAAIAQALAGIVIVRVPAAAPAAADGLTITSGDHRVLLAGACPEDPELDALGGNRGDGCVTRASTAALGAAISQLAGEPEAIADPRPLAAAPSKLVLIDGATLDLARRPQLAVDAVSAPIDVAAPRVAELIAALTSPAAVMARPAEAAPGTIVATVGSRGETVRLDVWPTGVVARHGEPVALRLEPRAFAVLVQPSAALRDASLWSDEAADIVSIAIDGREARRGEVVGEWEGGALPAAALSVIAEAIASPRETVGDAPPGAATGPVHHVVAEVRSPVGAPVHREMELEAIGKRCALRTRGRAAWIAPAACLP